ncbi:hypothetical protein Gogos_019109 [Gossypium gossypioides]|uniref:Uncharacterized protein n=1 Tax=Gossypium gossypioides TaxID=34282 RepID=A0A7J9BGG1_GOSGO|nr:hypothetical protein [Gossypium gossypioides]
MAKPWCDPLANRYNSWQQRSPSWWRMRNLSRCKNGRFLYDSRGESPTRATLGGKFAEKIVEETEVHQGYIAWGRPHGTTKYGNRQGKPEKKGCLFSQPSIIFKSANEDIRRTLYSGKGSTGVTNNVVPFEDVLVEIMDVKLAMNLEADKEEFCFWNKEPPEELTIIPVVQEFYLAVNEREAMRPYYDMRTHVKDQSKGSFFPHLITALCKEVGVRMDPMEREMNPPKKLLRDRVYKQFTILDRK